MKKYISVCVNFNLQKKKEKEAPIHLVVSLQKRPNLACTSELKKKDEARFRTAKWHTLHFNCV